MFTIITKEECPWCDRAKALLLATGHGYTEVKVIPENRQYFIDQGLKTVPHIYDDSEGQMKVIGGFEALAARLADMELKHAG